MEPIIILLVDFSLGEFSIAKLSCDFYMVYSYISYIHLMA